MEHSESQKEGETVTAKHKDLKFAKDASTIILSVG